MKKRILIIVAMLMVYSNFARSDTLQDIAVAVNEFQKGNYVQAIELFRPLANQGNEIAQFHLGLVYDQGKGVTRDQEEAVRWYRMSAEQGKAFAQVNLGMMYGEGKGVIRDYREALKWHQLAVKQENSDAANNLGMMYAVGNGVIKDNVCAYMWFNLAANKGSKVAIENRSRIIKKMTPAQITDTQKMARVCKEQNYKNCE